MVQREAEALRDGEQAARERWQAQQEMEQALVAQEQLFEHGTGLPIAEQADVGDPSTGHDGEDVVVAGEGGGSAQQGMGADGAGTGIASPGAGTDDSESSPTVGWIDTGPETAIEYEPGERVFEGTGDHDLVEQDAGDHAVERLERDIDRRLPPEPPGG